MQISHYQKHAQRNNVATSKKKKKMKRKMQISPTMTKNLFINF